VIKNAQLKYLDTGGPPSSPPMTILLAINTMKHTTATTKKTKTE